MKINIILFSILFLFGANKLVAQNNKSIIIAGTVDTSLVQLFESDSLSFRTMEAGVSSSQGKAKSIKIKADGTFKVKFDLTESLVYLFFEMAYGRYNKKLLNVNFPSQRQLEDAYLFENGDSVNLQIDKGGVLYFTGKGSDKLNCQWQIYNSEPISRSVQYKTIDFSNKGELDKGLYFQDKLVNLAIQMRLAILDSYKSQLSEKIYTLLYLDAVSSAEYEIMATLKYNLYSLAEKNLKIVKDYYFFYQKKNYTSMIDSNYMAESAYYADMLFEKEFNFYRFYSKNGGASYVKGDSFKEIYEKLKSTYRGKLRDKLIFICFENLIKYYPEEEKYFIHDAISRTEDKKYKQLLIDWNKKQFSAYPFSLQDVNGLCHKLSDYYGKLLIVDFWFTGCSWCRLLSHSMLPILKKYKNNKEVVFLTVCVDSEKKTWLKSIASGQYSSSQTINLYTNGLGLEHPLIKNYAFQGFPQQLIINKNGDLVTSAPPQPFTPGKMAENTEAFIRIIDDNL